MSVLNCVRLEEPTPRGLECPENQGVLDEVPDCEQLKIREASQGFKNY